MGPTPTPYDEAAYTVERALERAAYADAVGVTEHVTGAVRMVADAPYPGLVREAGRFGTDAIAAARTGDFERSSDYLTLLRHVVEDMSGLTTALLLQN